VSISPDAISREAQVSQTGQASFAFPLFLVCVALILILISAAFSPVTVETPGIESFLVGP
jgi:hypothetical protein